MGLLPYVATRPVPMLVCYYRADTCLSMSAHAACSVVYVASVDTESLTGPEAVTKAIESTLQLEPAPKTTVVHFKVSSHGITLTDLRHRSFDSFFHSHHPSCSLPPRQLW